MIIDRCPHCRVAHIQMKAEAETPETYGDNSKRWCMLRCQNTECRRIVLALMADGGVCLDMYPSVTYELDSTASIPDEIRDDFREAGKDLGAGCPKSSMVMSRRALQRLLKEQGCKKRNLADAIEEAVTTNILRTQFHALAEEIRQYGNLGAHPDDDQLKNVTRENAEQVLKFTRLMIHEFYEVPAEAAALTAARVAAKT